MKIIFFEIKRIITEIIGLTKTSKLILSVTLNHLHQSVFVQFHCRLFAVAILSSGCFQNAM